MSGRAMTAAILLLPMLACARARLGEPRPPASAAPAGTEVPAAAPAGEAPEAPAAGAMEAAAPRPSAVAFETDVLPILEARCQPCHFEGGKVYGRYPFDEPETIRTLGTKLFSRIKDESEQAVIRAYLDPAGTGP